MEDKDVLRYVINGFELIPAKQGFTNAYTTKNGKATHSLSQEINARIKKNFPHSRIRTAFERTYHTINFYRLMQESFANRATNLLLELLEAFTSFNVRSFRGDSHKKRTHLFVNTIEKRQPISLTKKGDTMLVESVELTKKGGDVKTYHADSKADMEALRADLPELNSGDKLYLIEDNSKKHSITSISKTAEFGGKGKGFQRGAGIEGKQLASINSALNEQVITMNVTDSQTQKTHTYNHVNGFHQITGNKKADFKFTGDSDIFVQHKDIQHQQLAGVKRGALSKTETVRLFVEKVEKQVNANGPLIEPIMEVITDPNEQLLAIYGTTNGTFSVDAVEIYCIGDMNLEGEGDTKQLIADKILVYPTIPNDDSIILAATYRAGRNIKTINGSIPDTRIGVYFRSSLGSLKS